MTIYAHTTTANHMPALKYMHMINYVHLIMINHATNSAGSRLIL